MITPSFSPTATERVLPKLALDFTTASLDSRVTFTRTTGTSNPATYINSSGVITAATNNQPRFDYDPVTLACKGLLVEESRENLLRYSQDISNASGWGSVNSATVVSTTILAPDNSNTAVLIQKPSSSTAGYYTNYTITGTIGTTYTASCFIKAGTSDTARIRLTSSGSSGIIADYSINLTDGSIGVFTQGVSATAVRYGNDWWRFSVTGTATGTSMRLYVYPGTTTVADINASFWGAQLEVGAFPTSYIPTTTTALTRNADVATMTGTNFSDWYNQTEGSFAVTSVVNNFLGAAISANNGSLAERIAIAYGTGSGGNMNVIVADNSVTQAQIIIAGVSLNTTNVACCSYKLNDIDFALNGTLGTQDTSATIPTPTQLTIGATASGSYLNGLIKKINYWNINLTQSEVRAFSK